MLGLNAIVAGAAPKAPRAVRRDEILVAGYPQGGDSLSITKGIVSRVVMTRYAHSSNKLLGIQIDAAINPGNSVRRTTLRSQVRSVACPKKVWAN